jgi:hypothetical protein
VITSSQALGLSPHVRGVITSSLGLASNPIDSGLLALIEGTAKASSYRCELAMMAILEAVLRPFLNRHYGQSKRSRFTSSSSSGVLMSTSHATPS